MYSGRRATPRHLSIIGLVLCLLAALFAIEAKLAWYAPDSNPTAQISASKLLATDAHRFVAQAVASTFPAPCSPHLIALFVLTMMALATCVALPINPAQKAIPPSIFSPHHFFRPPPTS
jgi:hypothetical protein